VWRQPVAGKGANEQDIRRRAARGAATQQNAATLHNVLLQSSLQDVAGALAGMPVADQMSVLAVLPTRAASAVFEYLPTSAQRTLAAAMSRDDLAAILNDMAPDDRTLFLSELPSYATHALLTLLSADERARTEALLAYPAESVGRLMTPDYLAIRAGWTVQQVLGHIREHGQNSETLDVLYVIDDRGVLVDAMALRDVLLVPVTDRVSSLMRRRFAALHARDDQRTAIEVFRATTVGVALVGVVLWGTLVGSMLPFGLRRLGFDPATSSAPFVATLVDVTGLIIYFSVGVVLLRGTLL
jgi:magnesium transporter